MKAVLEGVPEEKRRRSGHRDGDYDKSTGKLSDGGVAVVGYFMRNAADGTCGA